MNGVLSHDSTMSGYTGPGHPRLMGWISLWIIRLVQDQSLDVLTSSPACYYYTTDTPKNVNPIYLVMPKIINNKILVHTLPHKYNFNVNMTF